MLNVYLKTDKFLYPDPKSNRYIKYKAISLIIEIASTVFRSSMLFQWEPPYTPISHAVVLGVMLGNKSIIFGIERNIK